MVVVSIVALLAALAAPSFTPLIEAWRVRQATEQLQSSLYYARSEAIKRGGQIAIQKIPNNTNGCTTATGTRDWDCGWIICHDTNGSGTCTAASNPYLQRVDAPARKYTSHRTGGGATINSTAGAWWTAHGWASAWCRWTNPPPTTARAASA
jgi:type IV fimbrial biogenesis protein FimT